MEDYACLCINAGGGDDLISACAVTGQQTSELEKHSARDRMIFTGWLAAGLQAAEAVPNGGCARRSATSVSH